MLFNCSLLTTGLCNLTNTRQETTIDATASYRYSNWRISNCSPTQTQVVISLLDQLEQNLPSVIQAVQKSTETVAYRTFFKHVREMPYVESVFTKLAAGEKVEAATETHILRRAPPEFICTAPTGFTASYHTYCDDGGLDALTFGGLQYVILCPAFWNKLYPTLSDTNLMPTCPYIGTDTTLPNNEDMLGSKLAIMLHELIHLYMTNQIVPEVYTMRACAGLSAAKAAHNADNYTFFAMSKYHNLFGYSVA